MLGIVLKEGDEQVVLLLGVIFVVDVELITKEEVVEAVKGGVGVEIQEPELKAAHEALEEEEVIKGRKAVRIGCH